MAGDWIKLEHATVDKPEVLQMADFLETSADDVLGKLVRVWMWFDVQSRDGHAGNVTGVTLMKFIDRLVASQGFAACMKKVGWLTEDSIPNFDRHNGESSKNRALAKDRKAKERSRESHVESVTREEKRRVTPIAPALVRFADFWNAYPAARRVGRGYCETKWSKGNLDERAEEIIAHVLAMRHTEPWTKDGGKFAPTSQTYLNQQRWRDGAPGTELRRLAV